MKKIISLLSALAVICTLFAGCSSSSNELTEENVKKTVDIAFTALQEFDTEKLTKYVDSSSLSTIITYAEKHEQIQKLGQAIFENLTVEVKSVDLENKTVTVTVKNKDLSEIAQSFANDLKSNYTTIQLLGKLNDDYSLDGWLNTLKEKIGAASMKNDGIDITLSVEQKAKNLVLSFDTDAEDAVSGGAVSAIKSIFGLD